MFFRLFFPLANLRVACHVMPVTFSSQDSRLSTFFAITDSGCSPLPSLSPVPQFATPTVRPPASTGGGASGRISATALRVSQERDANSVRNEFENSSLKIPIVYACGDVDIFLLDYSFFGDSGQCGHTRYFRLTLFIFHFFFQVIFQRQ